MLLQHIYKHNRVIFSKELSTFRRNRRRHIWQQYNNTKESKVFEATEKNGKGVGQAKLQGGNHKGIYPKGYTAIHSNQDKDMDRVVLYGIPKKGRGAGKQGMVLPYGQRPLCLHRGIQKMHRRDRAAKKGNVEHYFGFKGGNA